MTVLEEAPPEWVEQALHLPPDAPDWVRLIRVAVVYVTPATAAAWLLRNTRNRRETPAMQERFARLMELLEFRVTTDAIGFFVDGALANGQNRLRSVLLSGVGQYFILVWNLPLESADGTDLGKRRNAPDIVAIMDPDREKPKPNGRLMAAYRNLLIIQKVLDGRMASWQDNRNGPRLSEQFELYLEVDLRSEFRMAQEMWDSKGREKRLLAPPLACAVYYTLVQAAGETYAKTFFAELKTGTTANGQFLTPDDPVFHLRNQLKKAADGFLGHRPADWYVASVFKAFQFWKWRLEHRQDDPSIWAVGNLKVGENEAFPDPALPPSRTYLTKGKAAAKALQTSRT